MSKIAKFESDTSLASEDLPKLHNLQTFVCRGAQTGKNFATLRSCIFITFQQITFKLGNFTDLRRYFSVVSMDFPELVHNKVEKTVKRCITLRTSNCPNRNWKCKFLDRQGTKSTIIFWYYYVFISCFIYFRYSLTTRFSFLLFYKICIEGMKNGRNKSLALRRVFSFASVNSPYPSQFWTYWVAR